MRRRLTKGALIMISLVLLVLGGNQLIIGLFSKFSEKMILENHELNALQELKGALGRILIYDNRYLIDHEDIKASVDNANSKFDDCEEVLSLVHKRKTWDKVEIMFRSMNDNVKLLVTTQSDDGVLRHIISHQVLDLINEVESLINETVEEINEFEIKNQKVKLHGTITIVVFGTLLILTLVIGSYLFIRSLTRPIEQLLNTTIKIGQGERQLRVKVDTRDEFMLLADSFNSMLDALNRTSISEKYLSNILNNLYGALLVTDAEARIKSINATCSTMLKYEEADMIGKDILLLFTGESSAMSSGKKIETHLNELSESISRKTFMLDSEGHEIPVYVTSVVLKNMEGNPEGMVVVGHDLTEEKENEAKMEKLRKERMIAIHEAQELERLRISRDLHDGLGQLLTAISYAVQKIDEEHSVNKEFVDRLQIQVDTAILEAKNIAQNLAPIVLKDFGLPAAIENLVQRTNLLKKTHFIFNSYAFSERIDEILEKAIYRICQEAVNNIIKHADASEATIELYRVEDMIVLVVEDDGKGFDFADKKLRKGASGLGLISMQERVNAFDGDLSINAVRGRGTEIVMEIPCRKNKVHEDN
ncbi:MAG: PAS domain S-box protein [Bacteroidales bacterium]|nr:PAS domain S-box protein [Bacteroidales bacterium]